ncbi:RagB/SusD family nutrient uptake outer membrane protein [Cytophagaceae bacterium YF14B1]|uniref:RagB/SusD family nutrient uptake outer membrane protein n=1 Tax=Xanthocytophaga flava TaxID=3048013 RepID=A0AAE3QIM2_9BACT|nr:RagB/SusD family nutrient uptake outer membrane protein [Xanthocytophaga flavus]MDJ1479535.1 RagB/SusD family nutrient uptake outer membrane protein [Xanthocytophaga flavus]
MKNLTRIILLSFLLMAANACTNLDENIYDRLVTENFYNNKNEVLSAVLRPYTHANAWATPGQSGWWRLSELSADQLAWPVKGRHGQDGGVWIRLHGHTWTPDDSFVWNAWRLTWWGLGLCTDPIENLEKRDISQMGITQEEKDAYIAELKLLRAFHYLKLMDLYGNIPIVTKVGEPLSPPTEARIDVFNFIEKEIKDNIDKAPVLSSSMIGRMSQAGGYAMLVELYLNAEVWTGTARWDDCIAAADKLISGAAGGQNGATALDPNLTDTFIPTNNLSKEILFSIAYEFQTATFQPQWPGDFFHFNQRFIYGGARNGNDGVVVIPGVYTTFKDADKRKKEWILEGPQMRYDDPTQPVLGGAGNEYENQPLVFVDNIRQNKKLQAGQDPNTLTSDMNSGEENSGVRFNKYKLGPSTDPKYNSTDWAIYRLSWIYFAKAEAMMRKNNGAANADAVELINSVKKRAFADADWATEAYTTATLTLDELLAERGREFIFEGYRRQDLIRFNKFTTGTWWDHQASAATKALFPIPQQQISLNENLVQNPGYSQ